MDTLLGIKKGMTSAYDSRGRRVGATVVSLGPNHITQVKTKEADGYNAIQLAFGIKKSTKKPQIGHAKKAGVEKNFRFFKEAKTENASSVEIGKEVLVGEIFRVGDAVKVTSTSKGKGFQGGVRRHGFHGGPKTHGQSDRHRAPGSIGAGTTPGRVYRGKKMAGHMGVDQVSYKNLEIVAVDRENNLITIKGGIPGPSGALVVVKKLGRIKGYTPPPEEKEDEEEEGASGKDGESVEEAKGVEAAENTENAGSNEQKGEENA